MKETLYLFHGMGGNKSDWDLTSVNLNAYPLHAINLSDFFSASNMEEAAKKIAAMIAKEPSKEFSLCGYSLGGRLAILTAAELVSLGHKPNNLILVSTGLGFSDPVQKKLREKVDKEWAELAQDNPPLFWKKWYTQDLFSQFENLPEELKNTWMESRKHINYKHLAYQLCTLSPANHVYLRPILSELLNSGISTLYIVGELDKKYLSQAQELAEDYRISVAMIAQTNHLIPLEAPNELAKLINNFLLKK